MLNKEHLIKEGLEKFLEIKASINKGLSDKLKIAFPNITVLDKSVAIDNKIPDPQWLAGFATAFGLQREACFFIKITNSSNSKQGVSVQLKFKITQHNRDESLIRSLIDYFNSGNVFKNQNTYVFEVTKISDLNNKIIPFFKEYPILGSKLKDFFDLVKVVEFMNNKAHFTKEGIDDIRKIKDGWRSEKRVARGRK